MEFESTEHANAHADDGRWTGALILSNQSLILLRETCQSCKLGN